MLPRLNGCNKRACTLISSYWSKNRGTHEQTCLQTESSTNSSKLSSRALCYENRQNCTRVYWSGLLAAAVIAASTETESTNIEDTDQTDTEQEEATPLPVDPPPPPQVIKYLDSLYDKQEFRELSYSLERYADLNNVDILWRRARAEWEMINMKGKQKSTPDMQVALDLVDQALAVDETNSSAHRWKAIISNAYSSSFGLKRQILDLHIMKYHLERAIELDPTDATVLTLLGMWHMELLELSWYERKFATTFLAALPECSYEEALEFFLKAEEISPFSWNRNLYLIAKTYLRLGDRMKSKHYAELALDQPVVTEDDKKVSDEAENFYRNNFVLL